MHLLHDVKSKWNIIGTQLSVQSDDITSIRNKPNDDTTKLSDVLQLWIDQRSCEVSWEKIITVIKEQPVNNNRVADKIVQFLARRDIQEKYINGHSGIVTIGQSFHSPAPISKKTTNNKGIYLHLHQTIITE